MQKNTPEHKTDREFIHKAYILVDKAEEVLKDNICYCRLCEECPLSAGESPCALRLLMEVDGELFRRSLKPSKMESY